MVDISSVISGWAHTYNGQYKDGNTKDLLHGGKVFETEKKLKLLESMEGDECKVEMWVKGLEKLPVEEFLPLVWLFCLFWEPLPLF